MCCVTTGTSTTATASALPSIYKPPWAGGESRRAAPHPPVAPPPRVAIWHHLTPRSHLPCASMTSGTGTSTSCSAVCGTGRTRRRGGRERLEILGTPISCTGTKRSTIFSTSSNLSHHQRHRKVERRHPGSVVGKLFHCVPLNPLLRPERSRPHPPRRRHFLLGAQLEVLGVCVLLSPWGVVHSDGTGWLLSPWSCVVSCFSQCHRDGHPLVAKPLTEPAVPPPPCRADITFSHEQADR